MRRSSLVLVAVTLLAVFGTSFYSQGQPQNQPPRPAGSRADEMLAITRGRFGERVEARSASSSRSEGYTRGTRKDGIR
jgi:hypothetical protein